MFQQSFKPYFLASFVSVLSVSFITVTQAADPNFKTAGITKINTYRAKHGAPSVTANAKIETEAQKWAEVLATSGSLETNNAVGYGQVLYAVFKKPDPGVEKDIVLKAIDKWYSEGKNYDFTKPGFVNTAGSFSQLIWRKTIRVGIGAKVVPNAKYGAMIVVVVFFDPPGNLSDRNNQYFKANVLPPK